MLINTATRELHYKLVYYGPSAGGKTANLRFIQQRALPNAPHALRSWADDQGRTVFFDYLVLPFGTLRGLQTRIHLFATPGAPMHAHTRERLLANADGVVFVADLRPGAQEANEASWRELQTLLAAQRCVDVPIVLQFNHCDAPDARDVQALHAACDPALPFVVAKAAGGTGVLATLKTISDRLLASL